MTDNNHSAEEIVDDLKAISKKLETVVHHKNKEIENIERAIDAIKKKLKMVLKTKDDWEICMKRNVQYGED